MSIQTDLTRIKNAKAAIAAAIAGKGVTVPDGTMLDGMAALIEAIQAGGTSTLFSGTITPSEDATSISIQHNMGKDPKIIYIETSNYTVGYISHCIWVIKSSFSIPSNGGTFYGKTTSPPNTLLTWFGSNTGFNSSINNQTAELYTGSSRAKLHAGETYNWYMM